MKTKLLVRSIAACSAGMSLMMASAGASALDLQVGETKASLYGFAELNMMYDVNSNLGPVLTSNTIALDKDNAAEGHFQMDATESRLGLTTVTPMETGGDLKTVIEGDFWPGGQFRIRHAYGEWNGILAGQTWTNFPGFTGIYPTVDFRVPVGTSNTRQNQLRYTTGKLSVALEESGDLGGKLIKAAGQTPTGAFANIADGAKNGMPDLTIQYASRGKTSYHASALVRQLSFDDGVNDDSALGWGVSFGLAQQVTDALTLRASVIHGDGIGGYMNLNPGAPGYVMNGEIETIEATGGTVAATLKMGPGAITLGTAIATADWDDAVRDGLAGATAADETYRSTHLNYIWSPVKKITLGAELGYHERETWSGDEGDALRIQGMAQYAF